MNPILFLLVFVIVAVLVTYLVDAIIASLKLTEPVRTLILVLTFALLLLWLLQHFGLVPL
jgi:hypothetical protein